MRHLLQLPLMLLMTLGAIAAPGDVEIMQRNALGGNEIKILPAVASQYLGFDLSGNLVVKSIESSITRDTEWDTFAEINAASTDTDAVLDTDIGVTVQPSSANLTAFSLKTAPSGDVVGTTDTQTLTNKSISQSQITSPHWTTSGSGIYRASGNVGIGTIAPSALLDVNGTAITTFTNNPITLSLYSTNALAAGLGGGIGFGGVYTGSTQTTWAYIGGVKENASVGDFGGMLKFGTRTTGVGASDMTRMVIGSTGKVGIGTVSPVAKLDVAGDSYNNNGVNATEQRIYNTFTDTSNGEWLQVGWKDTSNTFVMNTSGNGTGVSTGPARNIALQTNGGFVAIGTNTSLTLPFTINHATIPLIDYRLNGTTRSIAGVVSSTDAIVNGSVANDFVHRTTGGKFLWSTNSGTTAHLVISSGNVGMGAVAPAAKLEVNGGGGSLTGILLANGDDFMFKDSGGVANSVITLHTDNNVYLDGRANNGTGAIVIRTNLQTERMRITNAGDVGIGTASPGSKLDVAGGITLRDRAAMTATAAQSKIWSEAGEMKVIDAAGNITTISPHPQELMDVLGVTGAARTLGMDYTTPESGKSVAQPKARWLEWYVEIDHSTGQWEKRDFESTLIESGQSNTLIK